MKAARIRWFVPATAVSGLVLAALLWVAIGYLSPAPPQRVLMLTGAPGSDYGAVAERYRAFLARSGISLELVPTAGAMENLSRLNDPESTADVGFLLGGSTTEADSPGLVSLGSVFYEPLWIFVPLNYTAGSLESLRGKRISVGPEGSGGRSLSLRLLSRIGIDENFAELMPYPPREAAAALLDGQIQAATMMESWDSPVVQELLASGKVKLATLPHPNAYVTLFPYLSKLMIPAGVGDLLLNRPPEDAVVLAPKASLVVRRDLHPAIQYLLLQAAMKINSGPGIFRKAGQFPAAEGIDLPLSDEAVLFYKSGRPFLQRYLPFWLAVFVERLLVFLIPVLGVLYPVCTSLPTINNWWFERKVFGLYGQLRFLEEEIDRGSADADEVEERLERLESQTERLRVPLSHAGQVYTLRGHIRLVRDKLARHAALLRSSATEPAPK